MGDPAQRVNPDQPHAGVAGPNDPRNARGANPIDGSDLYRETEGRIFILFPVIDESKQPPTFFGPGAGGVFSNGTWGARIPAGFQAKFSIKGERIKWITLTGNGLLYFRLWQNGQPISSWFPIATTVQGSGFQPVSPFAGPATYVTPAAPATFFQPTATVYSMPFDQVEILNTDASDCFANAIISTGRASLL